MIIRRKHTANYTALPNAVLTDDRISIEARWCLAYLLSKPHDWRVQTSDIQKVGKVGKDKAQRMLRELVYAGWIQRSTIRSEGGMFEGYEYIVTDTPSEKVSPLSPEPENPAPVNPEPVNTAITKDGKGQKTERTNNPLSDQGFEEFWKVYPKREGANPKATALKAWKAAVKKVDASVLVAYVTAYAKDCQKKGMIGTPYIPMASTWLNQERWTEDIVTGGAHALTDERRKELERILGATQ